MRKLHIIWMILILFALEQWLIAHHPEKSFPLGAGALLLLAGFEILYRAQILEARVLREEQAGTIDTLIFGRGTMLGMSVVGSMTAKDSQRGAI